LRRGGETIIIRVVRKKRWKSDKIEKYKKYQNRKEKNVFPAQNSKNKILKTWAESTVLKAFCLGLKTLEWPKFSPLNQRFESAFCERKNTQTFKTEPPAGKY
jgi:hypothetical protein